MDTERFLYLVLDLGEQMLTSGAEVYRVEDTIRRVCAAYGILRADVFTITSSIVVTVCTPDGRPVTQTRRILRYETDLDRLDALNDLARTLCVRRPSLDEFHRALEQAGQRPCYPAPIRYGAYALVSGAFTLFFGGGPADAVAAALIGLFIAFAVEASRVLHINGLLFQLVCSLCCGLLALALTRAGLSRLPDKVMIGNIMLLIPGLALTNSLRDMLAGDTMSGLLRLIDALLVATAVAVGFALALLCTGGTL